MSGYKEEHPGTEARLTTVEQRMDRLDIRLENLDGRLRGVEVAIGRLEGKIDALTNTIVGQTSAALAKLPTWWQMPAVIGATVVLLMGLLAAYRYLQVHGIL